jgi:hypothetical protein
MAEFQGSRASGLIPAPQFLDPVRLDKSEMDSGWPLSLRAIFDKFALMQAPRRYSVSPLPSYATVIRRSPSTGEMARAVWPWLRGRHRQSLKHRFREARLVEELAETMDSVDSARSNPESGPSESKP